MVSGPAHRPRHHAHGEGARTQMSGPVSKLTFAWQGHGRTTARSDPAPRLEPPGLGCRSCSGNALGETRRRLGSCPETGSQTPTNWIARILSTQLCRLQQADCIFFQGIFSETLSPEKLAWPASFPQLKMQRPTEENHDFLRRQRGARRRAWPSCRPDRIHESRLFVGEKPRDSVSRVSLALALASQGGNAS